VDLSLDQVLGPLGLTVFLIALVLAFISEKVVPGARASRAESAAKDMLALAQGANKAMEDMADALNERNALDDKLLDLLKDR
jgi:hypothetical protein